MPLSSVDSTWILDVLLAPMEGVRQRRKYKENEWLLNYRAWQGWASYNYQIPLQDGAIHYFLPHARRTIERGNSRICKLLMPRSKFFQTLPRDLSSHQNAESIDSLLEFIYAEKIQTKRLISSLARSLQLYNFSILNTSIKIEHDEVWPYQKDVDPFSFYVFPDTASTRDEAILLFEDIVIPYQSYYSMVDRDNKESSLYKYIPASELTNPIWPYHLIERLSYQGLSSPSDFMQGTGNIRRLTERDLEKAKTDTENNLSKQAKAFLQLSKVYFRIQSTWYYCVICHNVQKEPCIIRLDEEENTPLYRWANERPLPGELYSPSQMDDIRILQTLANNALSQVESNRQTVAEPPMAIDRSQATRTEQYIFKPRAKWEVDGDPNQIFKEITINDTGPEGIRAFQIYLGLMDRGNGGTIAEGQPGRNMPRAGFAVNNLVNLSLTDTQDSAEVIECDLLTPGIGDVYHTILEYIPSSQIIRIPGKAGLAPKAFNKLDLYGNYSFKWQGALEFNDTQQVADNLVKLLEILSNPNTMQLMQSQGYAINFAELIQTLYVYSIGEQGLNSIITQIQQPGLNTGIAQPGQSPIPPQVQQALASLQGVPNV